MIEYKRLLDLPHHHDIKNTRYDYKNILIVGTAVIIVIGCLWYFFGSDIKGLAILNRKGQEITTSVIQANQDVATQNAIGSVISSAVTTDTSKIARMVKKLATTIKEDKNQLGEFLSDLIKKVDIIKKDNDLLRTDIVSFQNAFGEFKTQVKRLMCTIFHAYVPELTGTKNQSSIIISQMRQEDRDFISIIENI